MKVCPRYLEFGTSPALEVKHFVWMMGLSFDIFSLRFKGCDIKVHFTSLVRLFEWLNASMLMIIGGYRWRLKVISVLCNIRRHQRSILRAPELLWLFFKGTVMVIIVFLYPLVRRDIKAQIPLVVNCKFFWLHLGDVYTVWSHFSLKFEFHFANYTYISCKSVHLPYLPE
jgi:hypothetical protein